MLTKPGGAPTLRWSSRGRIHLVIPMKYLSLRSSFFRAGFTALLVLGAAGALTTAVRADEATAPQHPSAGKAPLAASFAKTVGTENAPYVLTLANASDTSLSVAVKVLLSVAFHADNKARNIAAQPVPAHKSIAIPNLAAGDKVTVSVTGYDPLELTVP
jgi:hypothetical protein